MKKKIIIPASIASVAAVAVAIAILTGGASKTIAVDTTSLEKTNIQSTVSLTGTVESNSERKVYSNLNYNVEKVNVKVGDKVKIGDTLCVLSSDDVKDEITKLQAKINVENSTSEYKLTDAEKKYNEAYSNYNSDKDISVLTARKAVEDAEDAVKLAKIDFDNASAIINTDRDTNIKNLESNIIIATNDVKLAKQELKISKEKDKLEKTSPNKDYENTYQKAKQEFITICNGDETADFKTAKDIYSKAVDYYEYSLQTGNESSIAEAKQKMLTASETFDRINKSQEYANAKDKYDTATIDYLTRKYTDSTGDCERKVNLAEKKLELEKETLVQLKNNNEISIDSKKTSYASAQRQLELARQSYNNTIENAEANLNTLKNDAELSRLTSDNNTSLIDLQNLRDDLEDCTVKAPIDGTVTAVYATEGASGSGLLFVIEDTDSLKIVSKVKEYDISYISGGQSVSIKSDAIASSETYDGLISSVAPAAEKNITGDDAGTKDFDVDISVSESETKLMIGMTTKLTVITEEKNNIYSVKYEALCKDEDEKDFIYIAEKCGDGYKAKKVYVNTGIESDFDIEISSDELTDGMLILNDTELLTDGCIINIGE